MPIAASVALALSAALTPSVAIEPTEAPQPLQIEAAQTVRQHVEEYFADAPVMIKIAKCESQFKQFGKKGNVVKNPNSTAMGIFQIMASLHAEPAKKMGMDIYTVQGNLEYARYLYEEQGTTPWLSSSSCWGKDNHIARS